MGGEPTLHPEFPEICSLYKKYFPRKRCGLCTCGGPKYEEYKNLICETFGILHYHNHSEPALHQPLMVASKEVIKDEVLRKELIEECWLQKKFCPSITTKGGFFCEVAATFDLLFNGSGGYPIAPGWWEKNENQFKDQVERYCGFCSIPIPMITLPSTGTYEYVSKENARRLLNVNSPLAIKGNIKIIDEIYTREKLREITKDKNYKKPYNYPKRKPSNYKYVAPLIVKLWGRNVKYEIKCFLKTGNIVRLIKNIFEL
jgi:hypothetical protein